VQQLGLVGRGVVRSKVVSPGMKGRQKMPCTDLLSSGDGDELADRFDSRTLTRKR